jgi:hypothetical protein
LIRAEDQKPLTLALSRRERGLTGVDASAYADLKYLVERKF